MSEFVANAILVLDELDDGVESEDKYYGAHGVPLKTPRLNENTFVWNPGETTFDLALE